MWHSTFESRTNTKVFYFCDTLFVIEHNFTRIKISPQFVPFYHDDFYSIKYTGNCRCLIFVPFGYQINPQSLFTNKNCRGDRSQCPWNPGDSGNTSQTHLKFESLEISFLPNILLSRQTFLQICTEYGSDKQTVDLRWFEIQWRSYGVTVMI